MSNSKTNARQLKLAEVDHIEILGTKSIVCGFHLADYIWHDIFSNLPPSSTYVLITDRNLSHLYVDQHRDSFVTAWSTTATETATTNKAMPRLLVHVLEPGETTKSRATKSQIEDWMLANKCTRDTTVLALGGGVIGDLVGYVAATFMRGVPFIQIPTSLLAMVDSSIGGKTAVDTPAGKNLIGAFWQPRRIYMDMAVLSTLPEREFSNGMAEVVKTAAIWSSEEFEVLEQNAVEIKRAVLEGQATTSSTTSRSREQELLLRVIAASAKVKAYVVTHDERESGMRGLLNFGHTIGHAIEALASPQLLHGECVSIGCVLEAEVARRLGHIGEVGVARLAKCLKSYGLPTAMDEPMVKSRVGGERLAQITPDRLMDVMRVDKKNVGMQKRLVLLKRLGECVELKPTNVEDVLIEEVVSPGVLVSPLQSVKEAEDSVAEITPPGSKSISNRALQMAALGKGVCRIKNLLHSDDTQVMISALQAMDGCSIAWEDDGDTLVVSGGGGRLRVPDNELYLGNAGTAARFLSTTVNLIDAGTGEATVVTGNARMKQRPVGPLVDALRASGCQIEYCEKEGSLPLRVSHTGAGFPGGHIRLAASVSSQYVSSILLCAPYAQAPVHLELVGDKVISQPYIDMTVEMMRQFGCPVERVSEKEYLVPQMCFTNPEEYVVESDASSATYPLAFAAITGTKCRVPNIGSKSLQGDARFAVDVLEPMGCRVTQTETETLVCGPPRGQLRALGDIDMEPMTDAFLTASVLAAVATGPSKGEGEGKDKGNVTRIRGIANQHVKECDRIAAMCDELAKFGIATENHPDGIDIYGRQLAEDLEAPSVDCYDDHRVAMSLSLLACVAPQGAEIRERRCVGKTWPQWWDVLARDLGASIQGSSPRPLKTQPKADAGSSGMASLVIIGMRGVGKTTLGRAASRALGLAFVDMDEYLEEQVGQSIPEIINGSGWDTFRDHESRLLVQALQRDYPTNSIIACGGGVVEAEANRRVLQAHMQEDGGAVVCLTPNMEHVAEYLSRDKTRPAYSVASDMHDVYNRRQPLYAECCNYEFLVDKSLLSDGQRPWSVIERDFIRLLEFATGRRLNRVETGGGGSPTFFVSLTAPDVREYLPDSRLNEITAGAHAIELRADLLLASPEFVDIDLEDAGAQDLFVRYVHSQLTLLRHSSPLPVVFTVRTQSQGGRFPDQSSLLRERLLRCAVRWGTEYVDVEVDGLAPGIYQKRQHSLVIASYHDTTGKALRWQEAENEFAREILQRARQCGDIVKLISVAHSWEDNLACSRFIAAAEADAPLIALNMGYLGQMSRILCPCLTPVTHPLLTASAAPGQISVREINQALASMGLLPARQFYLLGEPISQSPSPQMHNAGFRELGLPYTYRLKETSEVDGLRDLLEDPGFGGASVTIPLKQTIVPLMDELTEAARQIGAVNTIVVDKGKLVGDNTDYLGIVGCLRRAQMESKDIPGFDDSCGLVIGAGGTARAALYALHSLGVPRVAVYNRTSERAQELVSEFQSLFQTLEVLERLDGAADLRPSYIVGTIPATQITLPSEVFAKESAGVVLDMAYKPRWTPLLEQVDQTSWKVVHGVEVLIEQGLHQMARWSKSPSVPVQAMTDAVMFKYDKEF